jgi:hypothetical protein
MTNDMVHSPWLVHGRLGDDSEVNISLIGIPQV